MTGCDDLFGRKESKAGKVERTREYKKVTISFNHAGD